MDTRTIETFIHTAESGSFSQAALRLNYAQSTVTSQIKALEKELGVELFTRTGKRVTLSNAGRLFLHYAYTYRSLTADIHRQFSPDSEPKGTIRIGLLESIVASPYMKILYTFLHNHPDITITLVVQTVGVIQRLLLQGDLDFAIIFDDTIVHPSIISHYNTDIPIIFFTAPEDQPTLRHKTLEELAQHSWILTEKGFNYRRKLEAELQKRNQYILPRLEVGSTRAVIEAVQQRIGISLLPAFDVIKDLELHTIQPIPPTNYTMTMSLQVITLRGHWLSPATLIGLNEIIDGLLNFKLDYASYV